MAKDARTTWALALAERRDIGLLLRELTAQEWLQPSLCGGWRVRDVVAHQLIDSAVREVGSVRFVARMLWWRLDIHRANAWWVARCADRPVSFLIDAWERSLDTEPHWLVARVFGPDAVLRGAVIHHQDIRRPLGRPRQVPPERLTAVLDLVSSKGGSVNLGSWERAAGLSFRAADLDWRWGSGPEVRGPGEALLMALAGRPTAIADLTGDGCAQLAARQQA